MKRKLPEGWEEKRLGDVSCYDRTICSNRKLPYIGMENIEAKSGRINIPTESEKVLSSTFLFTPSHVLYGRLRPYLQKTLRPNFSGHCSTELFPILPTSRLYRDFLFYWFLSERTTRMIVATCSGARMPRANMNEVADLSILLPSIAEQKRIVAILDEVFTDIDKAKENVEQSIGNAQNLFETFFHSINSKKQPLGEVINIHTGKLDANAAVSGGEYPFFTCSREVFRINQYAFDCEAILLAGNNAVGDFNIKHYKGKFNAYQRTYVLTINDKNAILYRFLYFQLIMSLKELKKKSVGAATKFLKLPMIKEIEVMVPTLPEQCRIVAKLDAIKAETDRLEEVYRKKLADLEELRKSILEKAFSGEL